MISLLHLNKFKILIIFFLFLVFDIAFSATPEDIWKKKETKKENKKEDGAEKIIIDSPILSNDIDEIKSEINEQQLNEVDENIIGIFDPQENNFNLRMWSATDGNEIKKILKRISKLNLSKSSEDLLFRVLFTNAYPPKKNLTSKEFIKIKIDWLIKNRKFSALEKLLKTNPQVGKETKVVKFLINEYLSSADIKSACEKIEFIDKSVQNNYLDKFTIYCLINNDRSEEAQLLFDLVKERGLKDKFFENKINFLLGFTTEPNQKILDNNLLNFYKFQLHLIIG